MPTPRLSPKTATPIASSSRSLFHLSCQGPLPSPFRLVPCISLFQRRRRHFSCLCGRCKTLAHYFGCVLLCTGPVRDAASSFLCCLLASALSCCLFLPSCPPLPLPSCSVDLRKRHVSADRRKSGERIGRVAKGREEGPGCERMNRSTRRETDGEKRKKLGGYREEL